MARDESIRVRASAQELSDVVAIGERMSRSISGILNPDGSVNVSAVIRRLIREEKQRHA